MSRANAGMNAIYNGGLTSSYGAGMHGSGKGVDFLNKIHKFVKDNKLISQGASKLGYGRRRRRRH